MKKIAYYKVFCWALILIATNCVDHNIKQLFDKPAPDRLKGNIASLQAKLLASPQGWTLTYKPSKKETGYYQFLFRFLNNTEVEMASDFSSDYLSLKKSEYAVLVGSTVKLSFSTGCALDELSDSGFSPIPNSGGSGLKGDIEFLYYGENAHGDLMFKTNRADANQVHDTLTFKKATDGSLAALTTSYNNLNQLYNRSGSVYRAFFEINKGNTTISSFSFPYNARVAQVKNVVSTTVNGETKKSFDAGFLTGFGANSTGIYFDSLKRQDGQLLKNILLRYNTATQRFETPPLSDGTILAIGSVNAPLVPMTGQTVFLNSTVPNSYISAPYKDSNLGDLNTDAFNDLIAEYLSIGLNGTIVLTHQAGTQKIDSVFLNGTASTTHGNVAMLLTYVDKGDRLVIEAHDFASPNDAINSVNEKKFEELINFLTDPKGFYVENLGKDPESKKLIFTFTSVVEPSIRFAGYLNR